MNDKLNDKSNIINTKSYSNNSTLDWDKVDEMLTNETKRNKQESWSKINKTSKIKLLTDYAKIISADKGLSQNETKALIQYLILSLERKKLTSVRDVTYDKNKGKIINIPLLVFSDTTRKFVLQKSDKRTSTLKSLGKGRKLTQKKIDKDKDKDKDINISSLVNKTK